MTSKQAGVNLCSPITFGRGREKTRQTENAYFTLLTPGDSFEHRDKKTQPTILISQMVATTFATGILLSFQQLLTLALIFSKCYFHRLPCDRVQIQWEVLKVTSKNCNSVAFAPPEFGRNAALLWAQSLNSQAPKWGRCCALCDILRCFAR